MRTIYVLFSPLVKASHIRDLVCFVCSLRLNTVFFQIMFWFTFPVISLFWSKSIEEYFSFINSNDIFLHQEPDQKMFNFKNLTAFLQKGSCLPQAMRVHCTKDFSINPFLFSKTCIRLRLPFLQKEKTNLTEESPATVTSAQSSGTTVRVDA